MNHFLIYLLKVNITLILLFLPYKIFFSKTTFFALNRFYLLFVIFAAFSFPVLANILPLSLPHTFGDPGFTNEMAFTSGSVMASAPVKVSSPPPVLLTIYLIGCMVFFLRFVIALCRIRVQHYKSDILKGANKLCRVSSKIRAPFAFGKNIYIPQSCLKSHNLEMILQHEWSHVRQGHTIDNILAELTAIVLWFNPVVYFIKESIRLNHEYLADRAVIKEGILQTSYIDFLSETVFTRNVPTLSNAFRENSYKRRIHMMNQAPMPLQKALLVLMIVPLAGLILMSFTRPLDGNIPAGLPIHKDQITKTGDKFGTRLHPVLKVERHHDGIDFLAPIGTPVYATAAGKVIKAAKTGGYGNLITIQHSQIFITRYAHLSKFTVKVGDHVDAGQLIGYVGATGLSTIPHLHYEVLKNGKAVDPQDYIQKK